MQKTKTAKRLMSLIMALALTATLIPAGIATVGAVGEQSKFLAPIEAPVAGSIAISSAADLAAIGNDSRSLSKNYHLTADIDLKSEEWTPIGSTWLPFTGTFDGQGYVIKNLKITNSYEYTGLFGYIRDATIKNVGLEGTNIDVSSLSPSFPAYAGGICGYSISDAMDRITISNCYNTGNVSASGSASHAYAGGICGSSISNISNCYNMGDISALSDTYTANAGGICGSNGSYDKYRGISDCYNTGDVFASSNSSSSSNYSYSGGICGGGNSSFTDCYNTGDVSVFGSPYSCAGGICGNSSSYSNSISDCYNTGDVSASSTTFSSYVGGICGSGNCSFSSCYNTGDISASGSASYAYGGGYAYAGGICGGGTTSFSDCSNTGDVSASGSREIYAGGITSATIRSISSCSNTGDVSASSTSFSAWTGGICGYGDDSISISKCSNTGDISASSASSNAHAGGICGKSNSSPGTISACSNTGDVFASGSANSSYAGGICGESYSNISNCYNTGNVSADHSVSYAYAGGICGYSYSSIAKNCYNTGDVSASASGSGLSNAYTGGIRGWGGVSTDCYWNEDSAQTLNGTAQEPKRGMGHSVDTTCPFTTAQMKMQSSFYGFDFTMVWEIDEGNNYPQLRGLPSTSPPDPPSPKYIVAVSSAGTGASGTGSYEPGTTVSINAGSAPAGKRFKEWTATWPGLSFANRGSSSTSFTMPAAVFTVTAVFEDISTGPTDPEDPTDPSNPSDPEDPSLKGHVLGNPKIGIGDAQLAFRAALKLVDLTDDQLYAADIDGNGRVDMSDAMRIFRYALGLSTVL